MLFIKPTLSSFYLSENLTRYIHEAIRKHMRKQNRKKTEDKVIKVALKDIGKVCTLCGKIKPDVRIRSYNTKDHQGSCGDSFCWASCDLVSCKGRQSVQACDQCEKDKK